MNELVETVKSGLTILADVSLRTAAVALAGWAVLRLMRGRSAAARHAVCLGVLAGLFLLPVMRMALPGVYLEKASAEDAAAAVMPQLQPLGVHTGAAGATNVALRDSRIAAWPLPLAAAYLVVAVTLLLRSALRVRRAWRNAEAGEVIRDQRVSQLLSEVSLRQGRGFPPPGLRECATSGVPHALGWRHAVIVLPVGWRAWEEFRLRAVLAHELAHIRRGDWAALVAASVYRSLFWFHPAAWWLERELASLAEEACDACALAESGDDRRYAAVLLDFAMIMNGEAVPATAMARGSKIGGRIERILAGGWKHARPLGPKALAALAACTLPLMLGAAMFRSGQEPVPLSAGLERSELDPLSHRAIPGARMSATEAGELEARLNRNPEDLDARARLLGYYYSNALAAPWLAHLLWAIDHHPEAAIHDTYPSWVASSRGLIADDATFSRVQDLWRRKAAENPANAEVLLHAGQFFERIDRAQAKRLYFAARAAAPEDPRPLRLLSSQAWQEITPLWQRFLNREAEAKQALQDALNSRDGGYVGAVAAAVCPPSLLSRTNVDPRFRASYESQKSACLSLYARAVELDGSNREWSNSLAILRGQMPAPQPHPAVQAAKSPAPSQSPQPEPAAEVTPAAAPKPPMRISVGGQVQQSQLITSVEPEYPPLARQARISGVVKFTVVLNPEGGVSNLTLVSGHPLLVPAAMEAVRQYKYRPTLLNGQPVEVVTTVEVPFTDR
ncbi:MAG: TonB family protein [Acidobacteria bacterium]|nr:TonB family protein [Acidobacteriota bacterium]